MISYRPTDGDPYTQSIEYRPKTCFLVTQLGNPGQEVIKIRHSLTQILRPHGIKVIDAGSVVTGKDFLLKIWSLILAVPLGIAIVSENMRTDTMSNIFYELGALQAYGKETLIIKTEAATIPSDFVRTEYVKYDKDFKDKMQGFLKNFMAMAEYYETAADQLQNNPLLSIDYLRRAYLISANADLRTKVKQIVASMALDGRAKNSVEMLLANF
jgi:hypothetical protein